MPSASHHFNARRANAERERAHAHEFGEPIVELSAGLLPTPLRDISSGYQGTWCHGSRYWEDRSEDYLDRKQLEMGGFFEPHGALSHVKPGSCLEGQSWRLLLCYFHANEALMEEWDMSSFSAEYPIPQNMMAIIDGNTAGLAGVGGAGGLIGPGADLPIIGASWVGMTVALADAAGHRMDNQTAKKVAVAVATGAGSMLAGSKIAATAAGWIGAVFTAGFSLVLSAAGNAALNAAFTKAYGKSCAKLFLQMDRIDDLDVLIKVLVALIGHQMGFKTDFDRFVR